VLLKHVLKPIVNKTQRSFSFRTSRQPWLKNYGRRVKIVYVETVLSTTASVN